MRAGSTWGAILRNGLRTKAGLLALLATFPGFGCATARPAEAHVPAATKTVTPATETASSPTAPSSRPARWAAPLDKPGLPNLHRVSDSYYRGAQPSNDGMRELASMNVKTVVNLRAIHSDRDEIGDARLAYEHMSFKAWHAEDEDVIEFLRIVTDPARQPVFVHCQHGADRTGMMTAIYRIVVEGWSKDDAIAEMTQGGFGFHSVWTNLVDYVRELDVERIKREAGITTASH